MFSFKVLLFWTIISFVVGLGTNVIVANMWSWVESLPVWPAFNVKKVLLRFRQIPIWQQIMAVSSLTTGISAFLGYLLF